jgi:17beta-estradiol 17-dehydrogenase / very-long-chain 3-oxoacyl-CoA reductase
MIKQPLTIIYLILLSIMIFQILLLIISAYNGIYKYFFLQEKNLLDRYGSGSWVVITGASSGQGYDLAVSFAERGFNILMIGSKRSNKTQDYIKQEFPLVKTKVIHKDFRKAFNDDFFDDIQYVFNDIGNDLAILVNNVGYRVGWNPYHEMNSSYINDVIATGTIVQSRLTHMVIPFFLKRKTELNKTSALINITAQCMHPNFLFGLTMSNEISVPYLSVYEAANAFGFYQSNSIYKEYQGKFDILTITPGAVITENTSCLNDTLFNVSSRDFVKQIIKMIGNVQGHTCAYWGHAISNYLINMAPNMKDSMLEKVGKTIAADFMTKSKKEKNKYDI